MPKLLIIGCGRSGTRYASKVLRAAGFDIGHEKPGKDGMAHWRSIGIKEDLASHDLVWHQVRQPLGVIASFHTVMGRSWDFICDVELRVMRADPLMLRCMKYWLYWNDLCALAAERTYRVECLLEEIPLLAKAMGREVSEEAMERAGDVSQNDHTRKRGHKVSGSYPEVGWDDLIAADPAVALQIKVAAERYGYEFPKIDL